MALVSKTEIRVIVETHSEVHDGLLTYVRRARVVQLQDDKITDVREIDAKSGVENWNYMRRKVVQIFNDLF